MLAMVAHEGLPSPGPHGKTVHSVLSSIYIEMNFSFQLSMFSTCRRKQGKPVKQPKPGTSSVELVGVWL